MSPPGYVTFRLRRKTMIDQESCAWLTRDDLPRGLSRNGAPISMYAPPLMNAGCHFLASSEYLTYLGVASFPNLRRYSAIRCCEHGAIGATAIMSCYRNSTTSIALDLGSNALDWGVSLWPAFWSMQPYSDYWSLQIYFKPVWGFKLVSRSWICNLLYP